MSLNIRFDTKNDIETIVTEDITVKSLYLGTNFVDFLSLDIDDILSDEIISSLSKSNYKEVISRINLVANGIIIPEIIYINAYIYISNENINIQQIKKDLMQVLGTYRKFKEIIEFCYFNDQLKTMTPLQRYIYYLHISKVEEVILPKQTISSFGLRSEKKSSKLLKDDDILVMLKENSPFFCFSYECLTMDDYMIVSFLQLIENSYLILKCKNCGKYFIPYNRTDTYYCDRQSPQDIAKNCKEYAIKQAWKMKIKDETDWHCLYRRVYQSLQINARRNPSHLKTQQKFEDFKIKAKDWKAAIKKGTKTEEDFIYWLQEFRNKK